MQILRYRSLVATQCKHNFVQIFHVKPLLTFSDEFYPNFFNNSFYFRPESIILRRQDESPQCLEMCAANGVENGPGSVDFSFTLWTCLDCIFIL